MALKIEENIESLMDSNSFAKSYRKYFDIDQEVADFVLSSSEESIKKFFTEQRDNKITSYGAKVFAAIVYRMAFECWNKFAGPNEKSRKIRFTNGDLDDFFSYCYEAISNALKGNQINNRGGEGYDANRAANRAQVFNGFQKYFGYYLDSKCEQVNRNRSKLRTVNPDNAVDKSGKEYGARAWDSIAQTENDFADKDYDLYENLKTFKKILDESKYPCAKIFVDLLKGNSIDDISAKYGMSKGTVYYSIMGPKGVISDAAEVSNISIPDLAKEMKSNMNDIVKILAA